MASLRPERHHLMLVHSMLPLSAINGPGERAVVWLQGCDLRCAGCWNPSSHIFDTGHDRRRPVEEVGAWILACPGIEGVTFSGGEPFQQAPELRQLCEYIRKRKPALSIGVFTGYTLGEVTRISLVPKRYLIVGLQIALDSGELQIASQPHPPNSPLRVDLPHLPQNRRVSRPSSYS
jgi:hypothetical protein